MNKRFIERLVLLTILVSSTTLYAEPNQKYDFNLKYKATENWKFKFKVKQEYNGGYHGNYYLEGLVNYTTDSKNWDFGVAYRDKRAGKYYVNGVKHETMISIPYIYITPNYKFNDNWKIENRNRFMGEAVRSGNKMDNVVYRNKTQLSYKIKVNKYWTPGAYVANETFFNLMNKQGFTNNRTTVGISNKITDYFGANVYYEHNTKRNVDYIGSSFSLYF